VAHTPYTSDAGGCKEEDHKTKRSIIKINKYENLGYNKECVSNQ
jgi:hypothetical protein